MSNILFSIIVFVKQRTHKKFLILFLIVNINFTNTIYVIVTHAFSDRAWVRPWPSTFYFVDHRKRSIDSFITRHVSLINIDVSSQFCFLIM